MSFSSPRSARRRSSPDLEKVESREDVDAWLSENNVSPLDRVTSRRTSQGLDRINDIGPRKSSTQSADATFGQPRRSRTSWLRSSLTHTFPKEADTDVGKAEAFQKRKVELLNTVFDVNEKVQSEWPGIDAYLAYLEVQVQELWCGAPQAFFLLLGYRNPIEPMHCFEIITVIAEVFKGTVHDNVSISEIFEILSARYSVSPTSTSISPAARQTGEQAIFAAIGWLSTLYKPAIVVDPSFQLQVDAKQSGVKKSHPRDVAKRPIAGFLRGVGNLLPNPETRNAGAGRGFGSLGGSVDRRVDQIHTSTLNYYALKRIGNVNIEWVDTLSQHLEFHAFTRTLMVFRYPTCCALNCLGTEEDHCFDRVLKEYYNHQTSGKTPLILAAYKREVLLSYRLIFGQHRRSRKLFLASEAKNATGANGLLDALLNRLCAEKLDVIRSLPSELWPVSCLDLNGNLLEHESYSSDVHFPLLGDRLLTLQDFSLGQSPSRIRDLWRDRRNPSQWYTLWAVIIIGGISLILQIIQIFLSAAQLAAQLDQNKSNNA